MCCSERHHACAELPCQSASLPFVVVQERKKRDVLLDKTPLPANIRAALVCTYTSRVFAIINIFTLVGNYYPHSMFVTCLYNVALAYDHGCHLLLPDPHSSHRCTIQHAPSLTASARALGGAKQLELGPIVEGPPRLRPVRRYRQYVDLQWVILRAIVGAVLSSDVVLCVRSQGLSGLGEMSCRHA